MKISFGHSIIVDSGASKPYQGSFKETLISDDTNERVSPSRRTNINMVCPAGFKSTDCYTRGLAQNIANSYDFYTDKMELMSEQDKKLSGVIIYAPGATINNFADIATNLKIKSDNDIEKSLTNIDFNRVADWLKKLLPSRNIEMADDFKLIATNDMIGCGAAITQKIAKDPAYKNVFKEGFFAAFYMAGGGLGSGTIEHLGETITIKTSEHGHNKSFCHKNKDVEKDAASVPALLRNYAISTGITKEEDLKKLTGTGNAKIVGQYPVKALRGTEAEILAKTGLFKKTGEDEEKIFYRLKGVTKKDHIKALKFACDKFIDAIANQCIARINDGVNIVFLTGPLANGINIDLINNPSIYQKKPLTKLIEERIDSCLNEMNNNVSIKLKNLYNFKVILLDDLKDNTAGGKLILKGEFIGKEKRGNWLSIPTIELR